MLYSTEQAVIGVGIAERAEAQRSTATATATATGGCLISDSCVCHCRQVDQRTVREAICRGSGGVRATKASVESVMAATGAGTGCGACRCRLERMVKGSGSGSGLECGRFSLCGGCRMIRALCSCDEIAA